MFHQIAFYFFPFVLKDRILDFALSSLLTFRVSVAWLCWWSLHWSLVLFMLRVCWNGKADSWLVRMFESLRVDRFAVALVAHRIRFEATNRKWWINCRIPSGENFGKQTIGEGRKCWKFQFRSEGEKLNSDRISCPQVEHCEYEKNQKLLLHEKQKKLFDGSLCKIMKYWMENWIPRKNRRKRKIVKYRKKKWKQVEKGKTKLKSQPWHYTDWWCCIGPSSRCRLN